MTNLWANVPLGDKILGVTAIVALIQFVAFYLTVLVTRRSIKQPAIRAYISVQPYLISSFNAINPPKASYILQNNGITPAYQLIHECNICAFPDPLPKSFVLPRRKSSWSAPTTVFPNIPVREDCIREKPFSSIELEGIKNRTLKIYIFGQVRYRDAFRKDRFVRFCFTAKIESNKTLSKLSSNSPQKFQDIRFDVAPIGNDAD